MNADLKRRVRDSLTCYASTLHRETITATDPEVRELKARELAHVEALEREVWELGDSERKRAESLRTLAARAHDLADALDALA